MPILDLWKHSKETVLGFTVEQLITMAGDGDLKDGSECSKELRHVFSELDSAALFKYIDSCLAKPFNKSGAILQDIVNELGRRLDYDVENGLYSGRINKIGFDGIWRAKNGHSIIVEVKTTDAYRINLDTIAKYLSELMQSEQIGHKSSNLIIVGRFDTGDIEAQIRGSKHAWDTRLISIDSLKNIVDLKESADEEVTVEKIQSLLVPFEYTRLDNIIDVMFVAAKDVEAIPETEAPETTSAPTYTKKAEHAYSPCVRPVVQGPSNSITCQEGGLG